MDIVKTDNQGSILQRILLIDEPAAKSMALYQSVKEHRPDLQLITVDHEQFPTIARISRECGSGIVKMFLVMMLEDCIRMININEPSKEQVMMIAEELIQDYPTLKPEDYRIFLVNYAKGKYGKDYNRFDISTIYAALEQYLGDRADVHEAALRSSKHKEVKEINGQVDMKKAYQRVKEQMQKDADKKAGITERDKHRRAAAEKYADEFYNWCNANGRFVDDKIAVTDYAAIQPFNQEYIEKYIKSQNPQE